jgi:hypothetical protein
LQALIGNILDRCITDAGLQLSPPPRMVEAFVAQNPDCAQPTRPAQIRLKPGSSRPTSYDQMFAREGYGALQKISKDAQMIL